MNCAKIKKTIFVVIFSFRRLVIIEIYFQLVSLAEYLAEKRAVQNVQCPFVFLRVLI